MIERGFLHMAQLFGMNYILYHIIHR